MFSYQRLKTSSESTISYSKTKLHSNLIDFLYYTCTLVVEDDLQKGKKQTHKNDKKCTFPSSYDRILLRPVLSIDWSIFFISVYYRKYAFV